MLQTEVLNVGYMWLYRNDKDWLNKHSPTLQRPVSSKNRVNWQERDKQILNFK